MELPDWYTNLVNSSANSFMKPPGLQTMQQPALNGPPQALLNAAFGAPSSTSGGLQQGNPGPDASAFAPRPPSGAPAAPQASAPMPTPRPPQSAFSAYHDATAPAGGLASDPSTWKSAAGDGGLGYMPGGGAGDGGLYAPQGASGGANMIGPGSWMPDVSKMGNFVDKNSVIGKLLAMSNPSAAPAGSAAAGGQQAEAILPKLFQMFLA